MRCTPLLLPLALAAVAAADPATRPTTRPATSFPAALSVIDADHQPVSNANVVVVPASPKLDAIFLYTGTLRPWLAPGFRQTRTDAAGHCTVTLPAGPAWVVVTHEAGWAHARPPTDGVVRLQPWANVRGRALRGDKPAAGWTVQAQRLIDHDDFAADPVVATSTAKVAADGSFTIERVPPGRSRVCLLVDDQGRPAAEFGRWLVPHILDLTPGRTADVALGGDGRSVEGSVTPPAGVDVRGWHRQATLAFRPKPPATPMPPRVYNGTAAERAAWRAEFEKSPDYATWQAAVRETLARTTFTPAGWTGDTAFAALDLPPGEYTAEVTLIDPASATTLKGTSAPFTVPAGGPADGPVRVPPVALRTPPVPATVGRPAPDFAVTTLDGKPVRLSDYRGKVVLLDFWATWCGPCIEELPHLRAAYDAHVASGRFAILSVSYDATAEVAKTYVRTQQLPWDQAWVGESPDETIGQSYAGGLPTVVLIDADGTVLAYGLRGEKIEAEVDKALAAQKK